MDFSAVVLMVASDSRIRLEARESPKSGTDGIDREKIADSAERNASIFVKGQSKTNLRLPLCNVVSIIRIIMP